MFKAGIIAFAICVAAVGTTFWLKTGFDAKSADHVSTGMPSILEMARQSALERTSRSRSPGTILIRNAATAEPPRWIHRTAAFPAPLLGCAEKSPRQARAEFHTMLTTRVSLKGDQCRWCAGRAIASIGRRALGGDRA